MAAPWRSLSALHDRRRRHVVIHGGAAHHAGRFRRHPRRCLTSLHHGDDRLCRRRHADGTPRRPLRHRRAAQHRNAGAVGRLSRDRMVVESLASRARTRPDRDRLLGQFRTADGRHLALVRAPTRHCRRASPLPAITSPARSGRRWSSTSFRASGWRATHIGIGLFCLVTMLPLVFALRRRIESHHSDAAGAAAARRQAEVPFSPLTLQVLLCIAGVACCVAMSMPQVHIVAYCGDLGLWRRARRRDAVADARLRHHQPHRLRLHRRPDRRRAHVAARLGAARRSRCFFISGSTGSFLST